MLSIVACSDHPAALERRRREHELAHDLRMPDRHLHCDRAAVAEAEEVGLRDVQVVEQRCGVVRRLFERERAIGTIGGVTVTLLLDRDDLPMLGQLRQDLRERSRDRVAAAVQQHERWARRIRRAA
jgi:hypothetical protein